MKSLLILTIIDLLQNPSLSCSLSMVKIDLWLLVPTLHKKLKNYCTLNSRINKNKMSYIIFKSGSGKMFSTEQTTSK